MPVPGSIDDLSPNPASNYPVGSEPVFPNLDNYLRAHAAFIAQLRDRMNVEALPLTTVMWWGGARASIAARMRALDGQILARADFPALWAFVAAGGYPLVSDSEWLAAPLKRASFSSGDGASTFRMPDMNGKATSSIGAVTVRGDGAFSAGAAGQMQDGQNLTHTHGATINPAGGHSHAVNDPGHDHMVQGSAGDLLTGGGSVPRAYTGQQTTSRSGTGIWLSGVGDHAHGVSVAASGGDEARMKSATGAWVMRVL